ncbi:MAG TPA: GNAT family protein [Burkholderiales bacterium]|nr:GNAT family protein [Burkholderiales bacterium]
MQLTALPNHVSPRAPKTHAIRSVRPNDEIGLQQFIGRLSPGSRHARFMMAIRELPDYLLDRFIHPVRGREAVLVATSPRGGIIGLGQYVRDEIGDGCEVAVVVEDSWQRQGLGTDLLEAVLLVARESGIRHFHAEALADNYPMRALARKIGCKIRINREAAFLVRISGIVQSPATISASMN